MSDCLTYAIHYLSKYPKTILEAKQVLLKKWFSSEDIIVTIPLLEQKGYLNDTQFATAYLQSEVVRKGKPLLLIKQKLLLKGIEKHLLNELIAAMDEEMGEWQSTKIAKEIARLRSKGKSDPEIIQTLIRRWFSYETIKQQM